MIRMRLGVGAGVLVLALGMLLLLVPFSSGVEVTWETASEVNTAGFNVYRSENGAEPMRLNSRIIPAEGSPVAGASYSFVDRTARPFHRYVYTLEEIERDGTRNEYPQRVIVRAGPPALPFRVAGAISVAGGVLMLILCGFEDRCPLG